MKKKITLMVTSIVLVAAMAIGGTLAYLTSFTQKVTNTFTVGNVAIELDEAKVNEMGEKVDGQGNPDPTSDVRVTDGNSYKLIPGHEYVKDPTVTVNKGSEESYVRMLVTINKQGALDAIYAPDGMPLDTFFGGISDEWAIVGNGVEDGDTRTYEFRYNNTVNALDAEVVLEPLFTSIVAPDGITNEQLKSIEGLEIVIVAHAIQADGFSGADEAWGEWPH